MSSKIKVGNEVVPIDPLLIFQRISIMKKSQDELQNYLKYELAPYPLSMFDEAGMRKNKKSGLYKIFSQSDVSLNDQSDMVYVIDGGMLLHRIPWKINEKFRIILARYVVYLRRNFGSDIIVVFDGYNNKSTKTSERNRRSSSRTSTEIIFEEDMNLTIAQDKFLSNINNKERFIVKLTEKLMESDIIVHKAPDDADVLIVQTAIAQSRKNVTIVSEDIDVLVLLTTLCSCNKEIYFLKLGKGSTEREVYSCKSFLSEIPSCKEIILFIHAFTGCDTTSAFFNKSKLKFAKMCESKKALQDAAKVFLTPQQDEATIFNAGITCLLALYGDSKGDKDLNQFRFRSFIKDAAKAKKVNLALLPPTEDAANHHFKRVYHQVQTWLSFSLRAEDWGWKFENSGMSPITMSQEPAPTELLKMIFCTCKTGCGIQCGCRKAGLFCTMACSHCCGQDCLNCQIFIEQEQEIDDEIDASSANSVQFSENCDE